ncbi:hypothetical protein CAPTEDRAFT_123566, partial [Capitella teleta]
MCYRRLNLTHETGCSSSRKGNVGVLQFLETPENVTWLIQNGAHAPYVALLTPELFVHDVIYKLRDSGKINGLLVIHTNLSDYLPPASFSPDSSCPNEYNSMYSGNSTYAHCSNVTWNPDGDSLVFQRFDFPIGILKNWTQIEFMIENCYRKFNEPVDGVVGPYPLCAAQVKSAMDGAKDTPTCIRRSNTITNLNPIGYCDPLGNMNSFAFIEPLNSTDTLANESVTLVAARLDSFSLFFGTDPASDSSVAGFLTLLSVVEALSKVKDKLQTAVKDRPILFVLFNGEAFEYIGSTRMLYEMENNFFPGFLQEDDIGAALIRPEHIGNFIEIGPVGIPEEDSLWLHTDPVIAANPSIKEKTDYLVTEMKKAATGAGLNVTSAPEVQPLPPASFQAFLKKYSIPGFILTDHRSHFQNKFYNSRFDTHDRISVVYDNVPANETYDHITQGAKNLAKAATAVARAVYALTTNSSDDSIVADELTMTHMLYCFLIDHQCELFNSSLSSANAALLEKHAGTDPFSTYVGVNQGGSSRNWVSILAHGILSRFSGETETEESLNCTLTKTSECEKKCKEKNDNDKNSYARWFLYTWLQGPLNITTGERPGICVKSTANGSVARSAAFDIDGYDWQSNEFPVWTESRWSNDAMLVRVFLLPEHSYEVALLCGGLALTIVFFFLVCCVSKKSDAIF